MTFRPRTRCARALAVAALAAPLLAPAARAADETPLFPGLRVDTGGETPRALAAVDLDRDGDDDLLAVHTGTHELTVLLGEGDGTFAAPAAYALPGAGGALAVGDIDGDALADVVVGQLFDVSLFVGAGGGGLQAPLSTALGALVRDVELGDLDGDGTPELVITRQPVDRVSVHTWNGAGFVDGPWQVTGQNPEGLELGDVDLDGHLDAVTVNYHGGDMSVFLGTGGGNLFPATQHPLAAQLEQLALGDWNLDGALDAAATRGTAITEMLVSDGNGDGSFEPPVSFAFGNDDSTLLTGDLDRDGVDDLLVVGAQLSAAAVLLGGPGGLTMAGELQTATYAESAALLDADGDGALDLALGNRTLDAVDIVRGRGDGSFEQVLVSDGGAGLAHARLGDLDGDGDLDVVVHVEESFSLPYELRVLLNDGSGALAVAQTLPAGSDARDIALGDLDGDGELDVAGVYEDIGQVWIWWGQGDGTLVAGPQVGVGLDPQQLELGDVDDDGVLDLVTVHVTPDQLVVHRGLGGGAFAAPLPRTLANWPTDVELAHLDGDAYLDAVTTSWGGETDEIRVFHGQPDGSLAPAQWFAPPAPNPFDVEVGDLDHDGLPDLVLYTAYEQVHVAPGLAGGTFGALVPQGGIHTSTKPTLADVDGDGHLDWLSVGTTSSAITLLRGDGTLTLGAEERFGVGTPVGDPALGDMDGDGLLDVVTAGWSHDDHLVYVVRQQREDAWVGLDERLAGSTPWPSLLGSGSLLGGEPFTISMAGLPANELAHLKLGFFTWNLPFKGGTMVPDLSPPGLSLTLVTDPFGGLAFSLPFPEGAPSGFPTYWQAWFPDPEAIWGWGATNAIVGTTP